MTYFVVRWVQGTSITWDVDVTRGMAFCGCLADWKAL